MLGTFFRGALLLGLVAAPFACSGGNDKNNGADGSGGSSSSGSSGSPSGSSDATATATTAATSVGTDSGIMIDGESTVVGVDGEPCVADVTGANLVGVDLYLMFDTSDSMNQPLTSGDTKWEEVVSSLTDFVEDPDTADIGIGLQYFPLLQDADSFECVTNADCSGGSGPCDSQLCTVPSEVEGYPLFGLDPNDGRLCGGDDECNNGEVCKAALGFCTNGVDTRFVDDAGNDLVCETDDDCAGAVCDKFGFCEYTNSSGEAITCFQYAAPCPLGAGDCMNPFLCSNAIRCDTGDYATPAVEISSAADRNDAISASLAAQDPVGLTPTGPALAGAIQHAQEWAANHSDRKVVAVLATDGLPTECDPVEIADVADIAQTGLDGTPSVSTYVIGVFADIEADVAQSNLDEIAAAGGTDQAFVITTDSDVAGSFLAALNEIRGAALTCDFTIPDPPSGQSLDFGQVNLEFLTPDGETRQLVNVNDEDACADAPDEGWYYVLDDAGDPVQITVCPDVCDEFQMAMGDSQVNLQLGCATIIR